jgi:hypothetical protein
MEMDGWKFGSAAHAAAWSADVLRCRRWPALCRLWDDLPSQYPGRQGSLTPDLPTLPDERYALAIVVDGMLRSLGEEGMLLRAQMWGDWCDEELLRAAMLRQERLRREGVKVKLRYAYSLRDLGRLAGVSAPTVSRRLGRAQERLEVRLRLGGLV